MQDDVTPIIPDACFIANLVLDAAAGEMLHMAEPFLEKNVHPTVIVRGYVKALEDAIKIVDDLSFPIDTNDKSQMLKIVNSCIGTKFTNQFGNLMAVRHLTVARLLHISFSILLQDRSYSSGTLFVVQYLIAGKGRFCLVLPATHKVTTAALCRSWRWMLLHASCQT